MYDATEALRKQAHELSDVLGRDHVLWPYYESVAEGLDDLMDGQPDPWDAVPFVTFQCLRDDDRFDRMLVSAFREEWGAEIGWAGGQITSLVTDLKRSIEKEE